MAADEDPSEDHDALANAVRCGDILLFNGWYMNEGATGIKKFTEKRGEVSDLQSLNVAIKQMTYGSGVRGEAPADKG
jgi:hypothetical protein